MTARAATLLGWLYCAIVNPTLGPGGSLLMLPGLFHGQGEGGGGGADEASSSRVLARNLEASGFVRRAGEQAHHIVAGSDVRAAQARGHLEAGRD